MPAGAGAQPWLGQVQAMRPQLAGWLRQASAGSYTLFQLGASTLWVMAAAIDGEPEHLMLAMVLQADAFEARVPATEALLSQVDGIAFATDGTTAKSRGKLGVISGSDWQEEAWPDFWSRLLIASAEADALMTLARDKPIIVSVYSLALCRFVELSVGPAGQGLAGWVRLAGPEAKAGADTVARCFTYAGNPALQLPVAEHNPAALALAGHLATLGRRDWTRYLADIGRQNECAAFNVEFESGQALFSVQVTSERVLGPKGTLVGYHHLVCLAPDPALQQPSHTSAPAAAQADPSAEGELLAKEANHRIKNSLSMAASMLQLQSYMLEDKAAKDALLDSVQRLYTVSDLHEALYKYSSGNANQVEVKPFLENIANRLQGLIGGMGIEIRLQIEPLVCGAKVASRMGLLVNELVLNAAKYAFPESKQGFIAIYLTESSGQFYLSVQDNGQGMEQRPAQSTSLGNTLISEFAKELKADMRLETQAGTRYVFTFSAS